MFSMILAVGTLAGWAGLGANPGWTKTELIHFVRDEVTGLDGPVREKVFLPGIELLAVGLLAAAFVFVLSLVLKPKIRT